MADVKAINKKNKEVKKKTCKSCDGRGFHYYDCPNCWGSGFAASVDDLRHSVDNLHCPECNGEKYIRKTCIICGGDGLAW